MTSSHPASFRDPGGFVFQLDGVVYRQVNRTCAEDFRLLTDSGLYDELVEAGHLVAHDAADVEPPHPEHAVAVIRPEQIPFVSYPYEWSFSQLREAALLTLDVQERALVRGMTLKDASAYNVQFRGSRPVLIDTLSFTEYREGEPWGAYGQFCRHFLAPLALMRYRGLALGTLSRVHLDGVPLDVAARLLPRRTMFRPSMLLHVHLHARSQRTAGDPEQVSVRVSQRKFGRTAMRGMIDNLRSTVRSLRHRSRRSVWSDYDGETNYSSDARTRKEETVRRFLAEAAPRTVWDLGANTGRYSRIAAETAETVLAFDLDPEAVERHVNAPPADRVLPLVMDFANPSPSLGWHHRERTSLIGRGPADVALALALVHHLAIGNNVPLDLVADWMADLARGLVIEFVPKEDSQVQRMLAGREDVFPDYHRPGFERAFERRFEIVETAAVGDSVRTLYHMRRRSDR